MSLIDAITNIALASIDRTTAGVVMVIAIATVVIFLGLFLRSRS